MTSLLVFFAITCPFGVWRIWSWLSTRARKNDARVAELLAGGICPTCGHVGHLRFDSKLSAGIDVKWLPAWKCMACWDSFYEPEAVTRRRINDAINDARAKKADEFLEKIRKTAN